MKTPGWWYSPYRRPMAWLLWPLSAVTAALTAGRVSRSPRIRAPVPVIGVGNLTAGGAGKTPVVDALCRWLADRGQTPGVISRGYGGQVSAPHRVDPGQDRAALVGDEPLMLARRGWPVLVAPRRDQAVAALAALGPELTHLVLDDGHQDPSVQRDLTLVVVDGHWGFGNHLCLPAGPLREPVAAGLARADALVISGPPRAAVTEGLPPGLPTLSASLQADVSALPPDARTGPWVAFAGIARPEKLFDTLRALGLSLAAVRRFADHHPYTDRDMTDLLALAQHLGARLITTEKDAVRLPERYAAQVTVLPVTASLSPAPALDALMARVMP